MFVNTSHFRGLWAVKDIFILVELLYRSVVTKFRPLFEPSLYQILKNNYFLIGNWQLKDTFLALWTKIQFFGMMFFLILIQYHMGHVYAQAHDSTYQIFFSIPQKHFF